VGPLGIGDSLFQLRTSLQGDGQRHPGIVDHRLQFGLGGLRRCGLAIQLVGITTGTVLLSGRG
jgi:hypothetical protein